MVLSIMPNITCIFTPPLLRLVYLVDNILEGDRYSGFCTDLMKLSSRAKCTILLTSQLDPSSLIDSSMIYKFTTMVH